MEEDLTVMVMVRLSFFPTKNNTIQFEPRYTTKSTPWNKVKYLGGGGRNTFSFKAIHSNPSFAQQDISPSTLSQMGTLRSPCGQIPPPLQNNISARIICILFPELNVSKKLWELQSHKGKSERTGQDVWFGLSLFLKLHTLAHQTLVCIYLGTTVLIAVVSVSYWKSGL